MADAAGRGWTATPTLDHFWMPFTANRDFKGAPRMLVAAQDMHYIAADGRRVLDATSGLWCVNAGHSRPKIVAAVQEQVARLDFAPSFQMGHPLAFQAATAVAELMPPGLDRIFFTNSGSESVDSALKIALAYHRVRGEGQRQRLIGRERAYHGVGFGGLTVGGIGGNRKLYGPLLPGADYLPHTHDLAHNAFTRGQPAWGEHLADALERIVALHDASTIAAVIVEPLAGSTGVLVPPRGYLERLRELCTRHGILLIFDEVITGFGRLGASLASEYFGVVPDMITLAKGLTNGMIPMGAVAVRRELHDAIVQSVKGGIELPHGYTYSGHPVASAACVATLQTYAEEGLFARARELAPYFEDGAHSLSRVPNIVDIRNLGLVAGIELAPGESPGTRGYQALVRCFEAGLLIRITGDIIALSPPLIVERGQIDQMFDILGRVLRGID